MLSNIEELDNIVYINLKKRVDRKEYVETQLKNLELPNLVVHRFNAISAENPAIGCTISHIKCIEMAKNNNWNHVIVCEDDITFMNPNLFKNNLQHFLSKKKDWDVLLLAGNNAGYFIQENPYSCRVSACQTTTGYLVKSHYYDTLLNNMREGLRLFLQNPEKSRSYAIDIYWFLLQKKDLWFILTPLTVIQKEDEYSDIEKRNVNYKNQMLCLDKNKWLLPLPNKPKPYL